jgi:subtilisin family serine protease
MRHSRSAAWAVVAAAGLAALATFASARGGPQQGAMPVTGEVDEAGWQGVLGQRAAVSAAERYVVVLRAPSLASRVASAGGGATQDEMRRWTIGAREALQQFLARMAASGARISPEYRYTRVLNGFSARLDPMTLSLLDHDAEVVGVYPVRVAYPAAVGLPTAGLSLGAVEPGVPGLSGRGVTVALLDTGIDRSHPYLRDSLLSGIDVIDPGSGAVAQPDPTSSTRLERHGTELAGIVTGSGGPDGLHGIAPGSSILPIRVAGWQPDAQGGFAVYSRTDQIIAGLDSAVDPNNDGETQDAARIALVGVAEPYASFPDGPLARAVAGATALDMLVVAPAGNDGRAGPSFGSIAGPGGAPTALTVGATDSRPSASTIRVNVRAGLRVLFDGVLPLGGAPTGTVSSRVVSVSGADARTGLPGLFSQDGVSQVAGRAALLPRGSLSVDSVFETATAGATAVLVDGPLPVGAFSLDVPAGVPVVGLPSQLARTVRSLTAAGLPVIVALGAVETGKSVSTGSVAAFSSRGLAFGGLLKPELTAAGVAVPTSEPGAGSEGEVRYGTVSGTSAAAAVAAGAAAVLAQGRPGASASGLRGLLVGSARPTGTDAAATGAGMLDLRAAVQQEVVAEPATVSFGSVGRRSVTVARRLLVRNISTRRLSVAIKASQADGVSVTVGSDRVGLRAGRSTTVVVRANIGALIGRGGAATGQLVLHPAGSETVRVPWSLAEPARGTRLLSHVSLHSSGGHVSDATPSVLSLVVGSVAPSQEPHVRPVDLLEVQLWRGGKLLGLLARRRELLPGRYAFGLTGRDPSGNRLRAGQYVVRVLALPGDGTRRQTASMPYVVR